MALIGAHVSISGGLEKGFLRGEYLGCEAIQIFTKNQLQWRASPPTGAKCESFQKAWKESQIREVVVHASYLVNMASNTELQQRSINALVDEIVVASLLGIDYLVVHPGSHGGIGEKAGLKQISDSLVSILDRTDHTRVKILLETMAGQGTTLGYKLDHFQVILDELDRPDRLGLCLDTSHLFASGYDLSKKNQYQNFKRKVHTLIGLEKVFCWHFNDSKKDLGSMIDRHEHIGSGKLGLNPFSFILNDPQWDNIPCILETPKTGIGDEGNLALLRKLRGY
ncbi:MAG: deoxyribonuclease IV [Synergistales bacterium]|nr:deoxyribonuclease IV [Synergistales bacterium]